MNRHGSITRCTRPALLALVALSSCNPASDLEADETLHPTPENAPPADAAVVTTDSEPTGLSAEALDEWRAARDMILGARVALALGVDTGDGPERFLWLTDAAFDHSGNLLVLDAGYYEISTFGPDGQHRGRAGFTGTDDTESISNLHSLEVLEDGRILVGMRAATKVFTPVARGYEEVDPMAVRSRHMCSTAGRLFFTNHDTRETERVLHEVAEAGDGVAQSFGHGYLHEHWLFRNQLSDGTIGCVDEPLRIVFAFDEHPILRAHRPGADEPVWTAALEDFAQPLYAGRNDGGSIRMVGGGEQTGKPLVLAGRHIIWQTFHRRLFSERVRTYLIDAATGQGALISDDLPRIIEATPEVIVAAWNEPYPRIEVRELARN